MNNLRINREKFSKLFWKIILESTESKMLTVWPTLRAELNELEKHRLLAEYNTGSISQSSAYMLYALCSYFQPKVVAEVGTFIGKSTLAMARGIETNERTVIHTCDYSNDIDLNLETKVRIIQHKKTSSHKMFSAIKEMEQSVDLLAIDGRISRDELPLIQKISNKKAIVILDDFEGIEKGVINAWLLTSIENYSKHILVYPPDSKTTESLGFMARSLTAVLLPGSMISITAQ